MSGARIRAPDARQVVEALRDAGRAQLALLRAFARVRARPVGALVTSDLAVRPVHGQPPAAARAVPSPAERAARRIVIQRLELAIARAARRGLFQPTCLVRSLALADLLARDGVVGAEIRIGVRQPGGSAPATRATRALLEAHAWVELDGMVLGDDPGQARRFTPLGGLRAVEPLARGDR